MAGTDRQAAARQAVSDARTGAPTTAQGAIAPCTQPPTTRPVIGITMKRKSINLAADDKYGHWWFEIDGTESYGWWPKAPVGPYETLAGTEGELNGQSNFGGTATTDPHHGDPADEAFTPVVAATDTRTDGQIKDCLRGFARGYSGEWRWTLGAGQNCHTFQEAAMTHCGLRQP